MDERDSSGGRKDRKIELGEEVYGRDGGTRRTRLVIKEEK